MAIKPVSWRLLAVTMAILAIAMPFFGISKANSSDKLGYSYENLVATTNKLAKNPHESGKITKNLINAWGIAIRPAGMGGHFWVTVKDKSHQYVGDVRASDDPKLQKLHQDRLATISLPVGGKDNFATGAAFNGSDGFVITQTTPEKVEITGPAKFIFASDGGIISAWTEHKIAEGKFDWPDHADAMIDESKSGAQFFGVAISGDRLYAANFGADAGIKVYDDHFKSIDVKFDQPFDENKNGMVDAGEYAPFNIQALSRDAEERLFVAYAKTKLCDGEGVKEGACAKGEIFPGEEDSAPGNGRIAEFDTNGKLLQIWDDAGMLNSPWGFAPAPENFGPLSGKLLVGNFGDGTITAFDPKTHKAEGKLMAGAKPFKLEGMWGLQFGNGASLGDANALYVAAGPADEKQGAFGVIRYE